MRVPGRGRPLRPPLVLALDASIPVVDEPPPTPLARALTARRPHLREVIETLEHAAADPRITSLIARVDRPAASWAHAEELRSAVAAFRASGKRAIAHAQTFGEARDGTLAYYVACAFDEIHLQPSGDVGLTGLAVEVPFAADALGKLGVEPELDRRHEYKTAANLLTERELTEPHRETVDRIVASHHEQLVAAIAEGRGIDADRAAAVIDQGPRLGGEARAEGLVDRLAYRDETVADVKRTAGHGARMVSSPTYRRGRLRRLRRRRRLGLGRPSTTVALIHGQGGIHTGRSRRSPLGTSMGADTVATAFSQAIRDRKVAAILFRVDSRGGSAVASDAIWRAVVRAREAGKPVIVSMGSVAGSGGYWVAMSADRIVAAPGTLTGSIGVVAGKLVTRGLRERLGLTTDEAHRGAFALMYSANRPFTDAQWERVGAFLDRVYDEFVTRVADARGLSRERVGALARGRVWTGADATAHGLVDELGGYREAQAAVRHQLALPADAPLRLRVLPRQPMAERLGLRQADPDDVRAIGDTVTSAFEAAGLRGRGATRMPSWVAWWGLRTGR